MQTMTTMAQLVQAATDIRNKLEPMDLVERLDKYVMSFPAEEAPKLVALSGGSDRTLELTDHAMGQILSRLSIPALYFNRCPENLKWAQANYWIQSGRYDKQMMLRLIQGNRVRAALSESYTAFDDVDVIPMIADVLDGEDCRIHADFSGEYTHVRVTFPKLSAEMRVGDVVQAGLHFSNSEVGMRSVHIDSLVYRLVCNNGAVSSEFASRASIRHVGNPARLKDYVRQAIDDAKTGAHELIRKFKQAVEYSLSEPQKLIEAHAQSHNLTQAQLKAALDVFAMNGDNTLYGAANAFTEAAKREGTFERRYQIERVGTALLNRLN